ncbi:MAG: hypothetical protein ACKPEY_16160, partial [Planctomycetota bacterium]
VLPANERLATPARLICFNRCNQPLTNVTVFVELTHFSTAPELSEIRGYFVPYFKPESAIEFSPTVVPNLATSEQKKGRPEGAYVPERLSGLSWYPIDVERLDNLKEEERRKVRLHPLKNLGGVIEVNYEVWCEEGRAAERRLQFPKHAEVGAEWELDTLFRIMHQYKQRPDLVANNAKSAFENLEFDWGRRLVQRLPKFLPERSPAVDTARLARDAPEKFYQERAARARQQAIRQLAPGTIYRGYWQINSEFRPYIVPANIDQETALQITKYDSDTNTLTAVAFHPANLQERTLLKGSLQLNRQGEQRIELSMADPSPKVAIPKNASRDRIGLLEAMRKARPQDSIMFVNPSLQLLVESDLLVGRFPGEERDWAIVMKKNTDQALAKQLSDLDP